MARARRLDLGPLGKPERRDNGTLVANAAITRTGVFVYRNPDGSERREYRPPSSVFDRASMDSFKLVPVTDDHPPSMLDSTNARQYAVGAVGESIRKDDGHITASLVVHDAGTISKMDAGKVFVSCGYDCDLDETPGISPDGEKYDAIQTNIVGNHLAIVSNPRAGKTAAVRMDAMMAEYDNDLTAKTRNEIPAKEFAAGDKLPIENAAHVRAAMSRFSQTQFESPAQKKSAFGKIVAAAKKFGIDPAGFEKAHKSDSEGIDFMDLTQALAALAAAQEKLGAQTARADSTEKERDALKSAHDALTAKHDALTEKLAASEKARKDSADAQESVITARVALLASATKLLRTDAGEPVDCSKMKDREIKLAVIKHVTDADIAADKSEDYVNARYDAAVERASESADTFRAANDHVETLRREDGKPGKAAAAYDAMIKANRWDGTPRDQATK